MPSAERAPWSCGTAERGALLPSREKWGTNPWGKPSHATKDYQGTAPWLQYGFRANVYGEPLGTKYGSLYTSVTPYDMAEGCHECNLWFVFRDLGIPQGATISDARLKLTPWETSDPNNSVGDHLHEWRFLIYGLAEDDAVPVRMLDPASGYEVSYMNTFHTDRWPPRFSRRIVYDSAEWQREHTLAAVTWRWNYATPPGSMLTEWTSPNIASVISEIVARPGWSAANRLCLVMGIDDMLANTALGEFNLEEYSNPSQWMMRWKGLHFTTYAQQPKLTVTW
jgi:hypothetical protein